MPLNSATGHYCHVTSAPTSTLPLTLLRSLAQAACSGLRDLEFESMEGFEERGMSMIKVGRVSL